MLVPSYITDTVYCGNTVVGHFSLLDNDLEHLPPNVYIVEKPTIY